MQHSNRSGLKVGLDIDEEKALEKAKQREYRRQLDRQMVEPVQYDAERDYTRKQVIAFPVHFLVN